MVGAGARDVTLESRDVVEPPLRLRGRARARVRVSSRACLRGRASWGRLGLGLG